MKTKPFPTGRLLSDLRGALDLMNDGNFYPGVDVRVREITFQYGCSTSPKILQNQFRFWFHVCLEVIDLLKVISKMTLGLLTRVEFLITYSATDIFSV